MNGSNNCIKNTFCCSQRPEKHRPDLALRFVYPKWPALVLINQSGAIARDLKYTLALWNRELPDRSDPLPIPIGTFDWLRPHSQSGPQGVFHNPQVAALVKEGDRLVGSASITSPDSVRGRTYVVSIEWGIGGWFSEIEEIKSGDILIPKNFSKDTREMYFQELLDIPMKCRIPIVESEIIPSPKKHYKLRFFGLGHGYGLGLGFF